MLLLCQSAHIHLTEVRGPKMARIYAEEAERKGHKVKLAFEKEAAGKDDTKTVDDSKDASPGSGKTEQEVIVLRGGFTRW